MSEMVCVLCGEMVKDGEEHSSYRVEGDCKGFQCHFDLTKAFHNTCITKEEGINEIARAQVLDYLEAVQFNKSVVQDLKQQNLERAGKIIKQIEWRNKYPNK